MQTLVGNSQGGQLLATSAAWEASGAAGRLILRPASSIYPLPPAPQALMPAWELRGVVIDRLA